MAKAERTDYRRVLTDKIIEQLEKGTAPWVKPWDARESSISELPHNPVTGKPYRGANSLFLSAIAQDRGYQDGRWMTYNQAEAKGWQVRKGEKGSLVEYWKFRDEKPVLDGAGNPVLGEDGKPKMMSYELENPRVFRAVVFNAAQIDGVPELSKEPRKYDWDPVERAEDILKSSGAKIVHDQNDRAFYRPSEDVIHMPGQDQFRDQAAYYSTALHELGHWSGHETRLNRSLANSFGSEAYAKEELRAELSSYFMADRLGIPHDPGQHASYIQSWVQVLKEDKNEIFQAARDAEKIVEYVISLDREREMARDLGVDLGQGQDNTVEAPAMAVPAKGEKELTRPQREAVMAFRESNGRDWKEDLSTAWSTGNYKGVPSDQAALLQQVRNTMGPSWLANLKDKDLYIQPEPQQQPQRATGLVQAGEGRTPLNVPFTQRQMAQAAGARWDKEAKTWYAPPGADLDALSKWIKRDGVEVAKEKTILAVPFAEREAAKSAGARWDKDAKTWYAPAGTEMSKLQQWVPSKDKVRVESLGKDPVAEFGDAIRAAGLALEGAPIMDGKLHRVALADGKPGSRDGAYVGYLDGKPAGFIQNFKTGLKENWVASGVQLNPEQVARLAADALIAKEQRQAELSAQHETVAKKSQYRWDKAEEIPEGSSHPYLERKGVQAHGVKVDQYGNLVVPMRDSSGKLWSVQTISPEEGGPKNLAKGGRKEGNMHVIGRPKLDGEIIVAEGYATGASIHQATGKCVVVAFDSGNIDPVVASLKEKFPTTAIFVAADNDKYNEVNAGLNKAIEAAQKHNVGVAVPVFKGEGRSTDFNDLQQTEGPAAVREQIESAISKSMVQSREAAAALAKAQMGPDAKIESPGDNTRHTGEIVGVSGYHAAQNVGGRSAVVHEVKNLDKPPAVGRFSQIQYQQGKGRVTEKTQEKSQAKELAR